MDLGAQGGGEEDKTQPEGERDRGVRDGQGVLKVCCGYYIVQDMGGHG